MRIRFSIILYFSFLFSNLLNATAIEQVDSLRAKIHEFKEKGLHELMIKTEIELGRELVFTQGEVNEGMETLKSVISKSDKWRFPAHKARAEHLLGYIFIGVQNDYDKGLKLYFSALEYYEKSTDHERYSTLLMNLADCYYSYRSYEEAIRFLFQAIDVVSKLGDKETLAMIHNNLGAYYRELNELGTAIRYWTLASDYYKEQGDDFGYYQTKVNIINSRPDTSSLVNNADENIAIYKKAIPLFEENGSYYSSMICRKNMASIYNSLGEYDKSKTILIELLDIEKQIPDLEIRAEALHSLSRAFKGMRFYAEQARYLELYTELTDTLFKSAKAKAIAETRTKYQAQKIENENNLLKQREEVREAKLENEKLTKYGLLVGLGFLILFALFVMNRFMASQKQKKVIEEQKSEVDTAYTILEVKNNEILDSINYAKRIQAAILPSDQVIKNHLPDSFVFYQPKDIVAGDFYWLEPIQDEEVMYAVADCTGHGVPGAMVSVVCNNGLNRSVREHGLKSPGAILDQTRAIVLQEFEKSQDDVTDGMDIALVSIKKSEYAEGEFDISYAGANNPLWIVREGTYAVEEFKADKQPIGKFARKKPFQTQTIKAKKGDTIYVFSDGYADQFGGEPKKPSGKKLKTTNFKNLIISMQDLTMPEQRDKLESFFHNWMGDLEQLDDVCVMGVRL